MNKFKNLGFGLAAAALALGFSAFKVESKRLSATYYQTEDGTYEKVPLENGNCEEISLNPCSYFFEEDPNVSSFPANDVPTGGQASTGENWVYVIPE